MPAIVAAISSRRAARRGRDATIVRSTEAGAHPAAATRSTTSASMTALAIPRGVSRAGREDAAQVAQAGRAEQRVGHGVERRVAVGVAVEPRRIRERHAAEREWRVRDRRVRVLPHPHAEVRQARRCPRRAAGRTGRRPCRRRAGAPPRGARSSGYVTFRFIASPGTTWTAMLHASSRAASSVHVASPSGGIRCLGGGEQRPAEPLRRLGGHERRPIHGLDHDAVLRPLQRLGDRHDGDRGAVERRCLRDAREERRRGEWTCTVVDEHDAVASRTPGRPRRRPRTPGDAGRRARPRRPSTAATRRSRARRRGTSAVARAIRSTIGAAATAARVHARSGRPPISVGELVASRPCACSRRRRRRRRRRPRWASPPDDRSIGAVSPCGAARRSSARRRSGGRASRSRRRRGR